MGWFKAVYRTVRCEPLKVQIAFWFIVTLIVGMCGLLGVTIGLAATPMGSLVVLGILSFFGALIWAVTQIAGSNL